MFKSPLLRYNFRILMFHNWWLLVIPLAASQLSVFWTLVTQKFAAPLPASTVESVSPLLAAFLSAHLLAPEYRSGIGAVLAAKPVHIGKVVFLRLMIVMGLVWVLGWLSLLGFYFGMEPYPLLAPGLAFMISSLFLALFALTFATLLRHPLAGFGIATLYWLMDMPPGPPINPYLSLKSLTSSFPAPGVPPGQFFTENWWIAKVVLLVAALALYVLHARLLFTLGSPLTARRRQRALAWAGGTLAFYLIVGASTKVIYAYRNRATLFPNDVAWLRRQFAPFGPIPVAALFGPNFHAYLGDISNSWRVQQEDEADMIGESTQHQRDVRRILEKAPNSIWAASAADLLSRFGMSKGTPMEEKAARFRLVVDRYPNSPYAPYAYLEMAHTYAVMMDTAPKYEVQARAAYETLLARFPNTEYRTDAYSFLADSDRRHGDLAGAARHAQSWVDTAPVQEKFKAWILLAEILRDEGKTAEAKQTAQQAVTAVRAFRQVAEKEDLHITGTQKLLLEKDTESVLDRAGKLLNAN
jgi:ABC-type transport system involved in multi-copper enzyme maturation permease subunit